MNMEQNVVLYCSKTYEKAGSLVDEPKEDDILDFRQIALTNVEGKLFWSLISNKLYKYLVVENKIIDTSCQKGSIQKMSGCWEHMSMVWNALQDARRRGKSLAVLWLDLANAYGSVPHQLIKFALRRYGIPQFWIELIFSYYDGLWGRSFADKVCSDWHLYEKGIFPGCTLSVILLFHPSWSEIQKRPIGSKERVDVSMSGCLHVYGVPMETAQSGRLTRGEII